MQREPSQIDWTLLLLIFAYGAASLFHFIHNAVYIDDYPNLPAWISTPGVYAAWCAITAVGVLGWLLLRVGWRLAGLVILAVYAGFGFDGLGHYYLAPISRHTLTMNLSIWTEVVAAALLMLVTLVKLLAPVRAERCTA